MRTPNEVILLAIQTGVYTLTRAEGGSSNQYMCTCVNHLMESLSDFEKEATVKAIELAMLGIFEPAPYIALTSHLINAYASENDGERPSAVEMRELKKQFWFEHFGVPLDTKYKGDEV